MNKNIILAGAIAIGLYLFSQVKKIPYIAGAQKTPRRSSPATTPTIRQRTARKIAQKIGKTVAQKIVPKRIGQPTTWLAFIAAKRKAAARKAAIRKAAARKAAIRKAAAQKIGKKIGKTVAQRAWIEQARKKRLQKAAAQKIGKKIGKTVAQKIFQNLKTRRAVIARYLKKQRPQIQRPRHPKKQIASRLFSGAEKSRIIPYSESSRHSYYGPKSHKLQNEGYGKNQAKREKQQALEFRLNELRDMFPESNL